MFSLDPVPYTSRLMTKPTKWSVRPAKTQISLGIHPVQSESTLCAQWVAKDPSFLHADSKDSDQTRRMPRLIWVFAGHTCQFVGFVTRRLILCLQTAKARHTLYLLHARIYDKYTYPFSMGWLISVFKLKLQHCLCIASDHPSVKVYKATCSRN